MVVSGHVVVIGGVFVTEYNGASVSNGCDAVLEMSTDGISFDGISELKKSLLLPKPLLLLPPVLPLPVVPIFVVSNRFSSTTSFGKYDFGVCG